jgi:hypothetical protein
MCEDVPLKAIEREEIPWLIALNLKVHSSLAHHRTRMLRAQSIIKIKTTKAPMLLQKAVAEYLKRSLKTKILAVAANAA